MSDDSSLVKKLRAEIRSLQASIEQLEDEQAARRAARRHRTRCACGGLVLRAGQLDARVEDLVDELEARHDADRSR
jgi:hypothetical protein